MSLTQIRRERPNLTSSMTTRLPSPSHFLPLPLHHQPWALSVPTTWLYAPFTQTVNSRPLTQDLLQPPGGDHKDIAKNSAYGTAAAKPRALASTTRHHARRPVRIPENGGVEWARLCWLPGIRMLASVSLYSSWMARQSVCRLARPPRGIILGISKAL